MHFVVWLQVLTNEKCENYRSFLVINDMLMEIVYDKLIKLIIETSGLIKIIVNIVMRQCSILNLFING